MSWLGLICGISEYCNTFVNYTMARLRWVPASFVVARTCITCDQTLVVIHIYSIVAVVPLSSCLERAFMGVLCYYILDHSIKGCGR